MEQNTQNAVAVNQKQNLVAFSHKISVKLNENNFLLWKQQVLAAIHGHDLEKFISGAQFVPPKYRNFGEEEIGRVSDEYVNWKKQDQLLLCWILSSMTENMLTRVVGCNFIYQVWECLQSFYASQTRAKVQQLKLQLKSIKKDGMQMNDYLLKIKSTVDALAAVGFPLSTNDHLKAIFEGLSSDYDPFITSISTRLDSYTVSDIESLLLAQESRIERHLKSVKAISINGAQNRNFQSGRGASSGSFTNFRSNQPSNGSNNQGLRGKGYQGINRGGRGRFNPGRSQIICQLCNKAGHSVWNCFYGFDHSFQGFSNQQNSNAQNHTFRPQGQAVAMLATPEIIQDEYHGPDSHNLMHKAEHHGPEQVQVANGGEKMNDSMVKNMPTATFIPTAATKLLPAAVTVREERRKLVENPENGHTMSLTISDQTTGDTEANLAQVINHYAETLSHSKMHILGYPTNLDFDYGALAQLLDFHINNGGDPFIGNCFALNSAAFEVCVLDWFANMWEIEKNHYWGYITTGGTEGNLHGILVGREQLPDGILYTSQDSHYSVFKIAKMYRMQCVKVGTLTSGEINCADLKSSLLAHKDKPAIINLNIGTTMKGAIDDLDLVVQTLEESGFPRNRFYIHCDGALFGMMLPFVKRAPRISFKKPIGSITISGHKFLGCPIPCGVVITRLEYINALSSDVEIIASRDATITGSRGGHAPIFLWYALNKKGLKGLKKEVQKCIANARYLQNRLRDAGIGAMMNKFSSTVVFERPQDDGFARRWNLACKGNIAHIVAMQHVSIEMLDSFVSEFVQKRTVCYQDGHNHEPLCIAEEVGVSNCACKLHSSLSW